MNFLHFLVVSSCSRSCVCSAAPVTIPDCIEKLPKMSISDINAAVQSKNWYIPEAVVSADSLRETVLVVGSIVVGGSSCGGSSIYEHNHIRSQVSPSSKYCGGANERILNSSDPSRVWRNRRHVKTGYGRPEVLIKTFSHKNFSSCRRGHSHRSVGERADRRLGKLGIWESMVGKDEVEDNSECVPMVTVGYAVVLDNAWSLSNTDNRYSWCHLLQY